MRMGANAMVGAAKVANDAEVTAEAAGEDGETAAEQGVEADVADAAAEYGREVTREQQSAELDTQIAESGGSTNSALAKGLEEGGGRSDLVDEHGCVSSQGFAWCKA